MNEKMILTIDLKAEYSRDEGIDELIFGFEEQHNSQTSVMNSWETNQNQNDAVNDDAWQEDR